MLRVRWSVPTKPIDARMEVVRRDRSAICGKSASAERSSQQYAGMVKAGLGARGLTRAATVGATVVTAFGVGEIEEIRPDGVRVVQLQVQQKQQSSHSMTPWGRDPDLVRVLAAICPGLVALGAPMHHPAAPTGSPYTQDQMKAASSPNK